MSTGMAVLGRSGIPTVISGLSLGRLCIPARYFLMCGIYLSFFVSIPPFISLLPFLLVNFPPFPSSHLLSLAFPLSLSLLSLSLPPSPSSHLPSLPPPPLTFPPLTFPPSLPLLSPPSPLLSPYAFSKDRLPNRHGWVPVLASPCIRVGEGRVWQGR